MTPTRNAIRAALLAMAEKRGREKSFCPSEIARELAEDWRPLMPAIRETAQGLVQAGRLRCTQKGRAVDPAAAAGPIRLWLAR